MDPEQLDAILVTHEHSDHCAGVAALSRKFGIPVYLTHGTCRDRPLRRQSRTCAGLTARTCFSIGCLEVRAVTVPHDAAEPCQFRLSWGEQTLGILTDLGSVTPHVANSFVACHSLLLEFNHDLPMLLGGAYPPHLKRRVGGDWGHLNNTQAADLLRQLGGARAGHLVVAHISENNNSREKAEEALLSVLDSLERVVWAEQGGASTGCQLPLAATLLALGRLPFPAAIAPQPALGLAANGRFGQLYIACGDAMLAPAVGGLRHFPELHLVVAAGASPALGKQHRDSRSLSRYSPRPRRRRLRG